MTHVYLDGSLVDPAVIDPKLHRYVGMWRPATFKRTQIQYCDTCHKPFNEFNYLGDSTETHWLKGCFDVPMYETRGKTIATCSDCGGVLFCGCGANVLKGVS